MEPVTIRIIDSEKTISIPFQPDTNVQEALERAADLEKAAGRNFNFAIQYFGFAGDVFLGYLVIMIDGKYDNPDDPGDYWWYKVNGQDASVGIDNRMVNAGDIIEFDYLPNSPILSQTAIGKVKSNYYAINGIN